MSTPVIGYSLHSYRTTGRLCLPYPFSKKAKVQLNKYERYLPPKYRVYTYFNVNGQPRFAAGMAIMRIDTNSGDYIEAEVSLPPFGYCVSTPIKGSKSLAETQGLYEITWFSNFAYDEWVPVHLRLPSKETHEPLPLDYRSESEIASHYEMQGIPKRKKYSSKKA